MALTRSPTGDARLEKYLDFIAHKLQYIILLQLYFSEKRVFCIAELATFEKMGFLHCRMDYFWKKWVFCIAEWTTFKKNGFSALQNGLLLKKTGFLHCRIGYF
jgi:hypothetical protein